MKCRICNTEIVLVPSAAERARNLGGKPSDYTKLFTMHDKCALAERAKSTSKLQPNITRNKELVSKFLFSNF